MKHPPLTIEEAARRYGEGRTVVIHLTGPMAIRLRQSSGRPRPRHDAIGRPGSVRFHGGVAMNRTPEASGSISKELQIGKAGEHLVCADLILQGYNAFLADQGLPYDVLVHTEHGIKTIQVRSTQRLRSWDRAKNVYRFGLRRARGGTSRVRLSDGIDFFAFVALDIRGVAYLPIRDVTKGRGEGKGHLMKQTMDFKTRRISYEGRSYSGGNRRKIVWGKFFEDYSQFDGADASS